VQTVDFFTPVVDDPFVFGQIAAANALSDVYAMGGRPVCAMNLVGFPVQTMDIAVLREILRGGLAALRDAEVALVGGHSIDDPELKFGLSVTGLVHPGRVVTKGGARVGDALVLTKPLGTGIITTAHKRGQASVETLQAASDSMRALNRTASALLLEGEVHACTDITGYGLIGHVCEMLETGGVGLVIKAAAVPLLPDVRRYAQLGLKPGGLGRNRAYYRSPLVDVGPAVPSDLLDVLYDPQTSGGLFAALPAARAADVTARLRAAGVAAAMVGEVVAEPVGRLVVR
jgi:selenide,water dikinase